VVAGPPMVCERADVPLLDAVVRVTRELVRPARSVEACRQVVELRLGDVEREGSDRGVGCGSGHGMGLPFLVRHVKRNKLFRSIMPKSGYAVQMESHVAGPLSGRRAQARRNDGRIRDAARDVFTADPDAPMSTVAARAGVGISALYRRYASK